MHEVEVHTWKQDSIVGSWENAMSNERASTSGRDDRRLDDAGGSGLSVDRVHYPRALRIDRGAHDLARLERHLRELGLLALLLGRLARGDVGLLRGLGLGDGLDARDGVQLGSDADTGAARSARTVVKLGRLDEAEPGEVVGRDVEARLRVFLCRSACACRRRRRACLIMPYSLSVH